MSKPVALPRQPEAAGPATVHRGASMRQTPQRRLRSRAAPSSGVVAECHFRSRASVTMAWRFCRRLRRQRAALAMPQPADPTWRRSPERPLAAPLLVLRLPALAELVSPGLVLPGLVLPGLVLQRPAWPQLVLRVWPQPVPGRSRRPQRRQPAPCRPDVPVHRAEALSDGRCRWTGEAFPSPPLIHFAC
jgi:hypothetical protein